MKKLIATNFGPKTVDAFEVFELHGEKFFLNKERKMWGVTHLKTGLAASGWSKSRDDAKKEAIENFERAFRQGATIETLTQGHKILNFK